MNKGYWPDILNRLAQQIPEDTDLRERIQSVLQQRKYRHTPKKSPGHNKYKASRVLAIAIPILLMVMLTIPEARAAADKAIQQFAFLLKDETQQTASIVDDSSTITQEFEAIPISSLEAIQQEVPFRIPLPTLLPRNVAFQGARYHNVESHWVQLSYRSNQPGFEQGGIGVEITAGTRSGGYVFPDSEVQNVLVNGHAALYIQGSWNKDGEWEETADVHTLTWEADGYTFMISASGLQLALGDIIQIAESIQ